MSLIAHYPQLSITSLHGPVGRRDPATDIRRPIRWTCLLLREALKYGRAAVLGRGEVTVRLALISPYVYPFMFDNSGRRSFEQVGNETRSFVPPVPWLLPCSSRPRSERKPSRTVTTSKWYRPRLVQGNQSRVEKCLHLLNRSSLICNWRYAGTTCLVKARCATVTVWPRYRLGI